MNSYVNEMMLQFRNAELNKINKEAWKFIDFKKSAEKIKDKAKKKKIR